MRPVDINLDSIKGILLDLDDTLYDYQSCHKIAYSQCENVAKEAYGIENEIFGSLWKKARDITHADLRHLGASHSRLLYAQKLGEFYYGYTHASFTLDMEETYWSSFLGEMKRNEEMFLFLQKAKEKGIPICLVTDLTAQIQLRKWNKLELKEHVQFMVSSEEAGIEKPGMNIFKLALSKLQISAEQAIMIGDSMDKDVNGAKAAGVKAYHILNNEISES